MRIRFDPPCHAGRQDLELRLTIFEGREERLPQEREVRAEPALVSNSARSRASARLSATVVFVRRPRSSKSERSRLVVDRPASAAATSRSSPASRSERVTSFPITSSFTNREAACLTELSGLYSADPTIRSDQFTTHGKAATRRRTEPLWSLRGFKTLIRAGNDSFSRRNRSFETPQPVVDNIYATTDMPD